MLLVPMNSTEPSAGARWKAWPPMVLPAPDMFSGTTGRPSCWLNPSAMMRPTMSVTPATATGMISRIGRLGSVACAKAGEASVVASSVRRVGMGMVPASRSCEV